ncbi:MAG: TatD family hydrolase [Bacteroidales bacterium]
MIDTHAHIYAKEFDPDRDDVVKRAIEAGVEKIILANVDRNSLQSLLDVCQKYPDICVPTIGLHPTEIGADYEKELDYLETQIGLHPYKAIGEIGFDLYWDKTYHKEQVDAFRRQTEWAHKLNLPVIIHVRDAFGLLHPELERCKSLNLHGIIHSFSGNAEDVRKIRSYGDYYFGINGIATFKKSTLPEVIREIGIDHLVVETDAPYLAPVPFRGKRNEPSLVVHTAKKIAEILGMDEKEVERITTENAKKLFGI